MNYKGQVCGWTRGAERKGIDDAVASRRSMVMQMVNFFRLIRPSILLPIPYVLLPCMLYCDTILKYCYVYDDSESVSITN